MPGAGKQDFALKSVTTDGNLMVRSHMKHHEPDVLHGLDVWHLCKNLARNVALKAKRAVSITTLLLNIYTHARRRNLVELQFSNSFQNTPAAG